jgi:hypothetical protein
MEIAILKVFGNGTEGRKRGFGQARSNPVKVEEGFDWAFGESTAVWWRLALLCAVSHVERGRD